MSRRRAFHGFCALLLAALAPVAACKKKEPTKEEMCKSIAKDATDLARNFLKALGGKDVPKSDYDKLDEEQKSMEGKCLTWSDEAVRCTYKNDTSPACQKATEEISDSLSGAPPKAPAGPATAYEYTLGDTPRALALGPSGLAVAVTDDSVKAVRADVVWTLPGKHNRWILGFDDWMFVSPDEGGKVVAVAADSGKEVFSVAVPAERENGLSPTVYGALRDGDGVLLTLYDGRLMRLLPSVCKDKQSIDPAAATKPAESMDGEDTESKKPKPKPKKVEAAAEGPFCLSLLGELPEDATFDSDVDLFRLADGRILAHDYRGIRVINRTGKTDMDWRGWDSVGGVVPAGAGAIVGMVDGRITSLSMADCGPGPFVVGAMPRGGEQCEGCVRALPGCEKWSWSNDSIEHREPSFLPGDRTVVVVDRELVLLGSDGKQLWKKPVGGTGPVVNTKDGKLLIACWGRDEEPAGLCAVDEKDGSLSWRTPFKDKAAGMLYSVDEVWLQQFGDWVLVGIDKQLAAFKL